MILIIPIIPNNSYYTLLTRANDSTAALPGCRPTMTLWRRGGVRPRRPKNNEATVSLETNKSFQSPSKAWERPGETESADMVRPRERE